MNASSIRPLCAAVLVAASWTAQAQPPSPTRGQLLYETHCIECHTQQVHWRDARKARNWATLKAEVFRWQKIARLDWGEADVLEVTRHLNATVYRFAPSQSGRGTRVASAAAD